jgi:ATP-dependent Clp protease ATP-binding subunit ClpA
MGIKRPKKWFFSEVAGQALRLAIQRPTGKHFATTTSDLLLALLKTREGNHAKVFAKFNIDIHKAASKLSRIIGSAPLVKTPRFKFAPDLKKVFHLSKRFSKSRGFSEIDSHHLLVGLIESRCKRHLVKIGFDDLEKLAKEVEQISDSTSPSLPSLRLLIAPGTAPVEAIADILSDLSVLYRLKGGSGINFDLDSVFAIDEEFV